MHDTKHETKVQAATCKEFYFEFHATKKEIDEASELKMSLQKLTQNLKDKISSKVSFQSWCMILLLRPFKTC